jgi:hypothetical protein
MIQRVQSVLLAIIATLMVAVLFLPLYVKVDEVSKEQLLLTAQQIVRTDSAGAVLSSQNVIYVGGLALIAAGISVYSLISFRNRKMQLWLGFANTLVIAGFLGLTFYHSAITIEQNIGLKSLGTREIGFYLPLVALIFNYAANRLIRSDEKLVRSMDRIR